MTADQQAAADVDALSYEQAIGELTEVVQALEQGGLALEESLALWERGEALAGVCERRLAGAQQRIDEALQAAEADVTDE